jgi:hypothetical protein
VEVENRKYGYSTRSSRLYTFLVGQSNRALLTESIGNFKRVESMGVDGAFDEVVYYGVKRLWWERKKRVGGCGRVEDIRLRECA